MWCHKVHEYHTARGWFQTLRSLRFVSLFQMQMSQFFPSSFTYTQEQQKHKDIMQTDFQKMGQTGLIYYSKLHTCRTHTRKKHDGGLTVLSMLLLFEVKCILSNGKFEKSKSSHMGSVRRNFIRNATPSILRLRLPACIEFCSCLIYHSSCTLLSFSKQCTVSCKLIDFNHGFHFTWFRVNFSF